MVAVEPPGSKGRNLWVPMGRKEGLEQLMAEGLAFPRTTARDATGHYGHFYCKVSTKASNSRTFFSCTASFSGRESKSSAMDWAPMSMERLLS